MKFSLIIAGLFMIPALLSGQDAREIVRRYLDKVSNGNIENWKKIKSTYTESEGYYSQNDFDQKVNLLKPDKSTFSKTYTVWPQQKIEGYADSTFLNLISQFYFLKDQTIIIIGNIPPIIKPAPPRNEFVDEFMPVMVWKLLNKSKSIELAGIRDFPTDGVSCFEIRIRSTTMNCSLYINTETFLLDFSNQREDGDLSFLVKYDNYQKIGEYLMPMSELNMHNGVVFHWVNKRKVELNVEIDPEKFKYQTN